MQRGSHGLAPRIAGRHRERDVGKPVEGQYAWPEPAAASVRIPRCMANAKATINTPYGRNPAKFMTPAAGAPVAPSSLMKFLS